MSLKNKKQFGVWMDTQDTIVVGRAGEDSSEFSVIGRVRNPGVGPNSNENAANHLEITLLQKYFREIAALMVNAEQVHVTGTGTIQEQFVHFLEDTPQFKKTVATESTSNQMAEQQLVDFVRGKFGSK